MPLYDFRCPKCGLEFEVSRPFSRADEPTNCPQDGTESERLFSMRVAFVHRGGASEPSDSETGGFGGLGHDHGPGGHSHGSGGHTH